MYIIYTISVWSIAPIAPKIAVLLQPTPWGDSASGSVVSPSGSVSVCTCSKSLGQMNYGIIININGILMGFYGILWDNLWDFMG